MLSMKLGYTATRWQHFFKSTLCSTPTICKMFGAYSRDQGIVEAGD